jgi:hypothetical protein
MPAIYGTGALKTSFGPARVDLQSVVVAEDVNPVYEEIVAVQKFLGIDIHKRAQNWGTGTYSTQATQWTDLKTRLENAENGVHISVLTTGGAIIQNGTSPAGTSVTAASLTIRAASGQSSSLIDFRNSSNTVVASVKVDGTLTALALDGGNAASATNAGA